VSEFRTIITIIITIIIIIIYILIVTIYQNGGKLQKYQIKNIIFLK